MRLYYIDGLKAIGCFLVFFCHFNGLLHLVDFIGPLKFLCNGEFAVALFGVLSGFSIAICPYKDATQSGVVQTSFSMGVPVIATNVGALPETVKDGVNGIIVPACDVKSLSVSISELYTDKIKLEEFRKNIKSNWARQNEWNTIAKDYIKTYTV